MCLHFFHLYWYVSVFGPRALFFMYSPRHLVFVYSALLVWRLAYGSALLVFRSACCVFGDFCYAYYSPLLVCLDLFLFFVIPLNSEFMFLAYFDATHLFTKLLSAKGATLVLLLFL